MPFSPVPHKSNFHGGDDICIFHQDWFELIDVLKHQLNTGSNDIPERLLYQAPTDRPIPEREIFARALREAVISESLFETLGMLYEQRNRVVPRWPGWTREERLTRGWYGTEEG